MSSEQIEIRGYGDIDRFRFSKFTDPESGMTLHPMTGERPQLARAAAIEMGVDRAHLYYEDPPSNEAELIAAYANNLQKGDAIYEIILREGSVAGNTGLQRFILFPPTNHRAAARIVLGTEFQKQGIATVATKILLRASALAGMHSIEALIHMDNIDSINLYRQFAWESDKTRKSEPWILFRIPLARLDFTRTMPIEVTKP